ncbi:antibiotic biosynthesis monooxygenase [Caldibacillus lycopersici]|uniref:Antibiotic biosynthesis monooxygenase n=1 Tax=Perspicuibacillus lycopersici TaxID=1325689 RepID=A0AAE3IRW1_9BACI|nr:antibiotic biosynthesis monooxygenase [Perspicuibacillus lycopersici]MCU9612498.1 antibiotic biosynthesis monooxygenase [Perspicuibacillus lycopersici]
MEKIFITTGTYPFLQKIEAKYPTEKLVMMFSSDHVLLLHETSGKSIFQVPRKYDVFHSDGEFPRKGVAIFQHIPINEENRPIFEYHAKKLLDNSSTVKGLIAFRMLRPAKSDTYIIITCWEKAEDFSNWKKMQVLFEEDGMLSKLTPPPGNVYQSPSYIATYTIDREMNASQEEN